MEGCTCLNIWINLPFIFCLLNKQGPTGSVLGVLLKKHRLFQQIPAPDLACAKNGNPNG